MLILKLDYKSKKNCLENFMTKKMLFYITEISMKKFPRIKITELIIIGGVANKNVYNSIFRK